MANVSLSTMMFVTLLAIISTTLPLAASFFSSPIHHYAQDLFNQIPQKNDALPQPGRVAVVGAGAAGSSTAYHLRQYASNRSMLINITIFESSPHVGGRSTTVNALGHPEYPAELGASIFASVNHILIDAAKEFGLTTVDPGVDRPRQGKYEIGIWDGEHFVYKTSNYGSGWMDVVKLFWRYGLAPLKTQRLTKSTVARFLAMYEEPVFPWRSLTEAAMQVGLLDATASTGRRFLQRNGVSEKFGREIIQASTRVNYGQNLGLIHGLETMVCMATDGAMAVQGGNWQIFQGMVNRSLAEVKMETRVQTVSRLPKGGYKITASDATGYRQISESFDHVVIAAPFQYASLDVSPPLEQPPNKIPYVTLYVTLLTSPHRLSNDFFTDLGGRRSDKDGRAIPEMIITSLPAHLDLGASPRGVGPTNFWSVSTLRTVAVNGTGQYLYKIFSPEPLTAKFLSDLLEFPVSLDTNSSQEAGSIQAIDKSDVSWSYEKKWHSYPFEYPRVTFDDPNLDGAGLWYTSGMESFISTMETSALMGKNVAKLIVDEM
jgi:prenylcysteine oxidase / farnesylcysteine lyase